MHTYSPCSRWPSSLMSTQNISVWIDIGWTRYCPKMSSLQFSQLTRSNSKVTILVTFTCCTHNTTWPPVRRINVWFVEVNISLMSKRRFYWNSWIHNLFKVEIDNLQWTNICNILVGHPGTPYKV